MDRPYPHHQVVGEGPTTDACFAAFAEDLTKALAKQPEGTIGQWRNHPEILKNNDFASNSMSYILRGRLVFVPRRSPVPDFPFVIPIYPYWSQQAPINEVR